MNRLGRHAMASLLVMTVGATGLDTVEAAAEPLEVFVSVEPQAYLVQRVGGKHVKVRVLVQPGQDPHTFAPTPRQMTALAKARLFFKVGMAFEERLLEKIRGSHRRLRVVDTARGIKRRVADAHDHDQDPHDHGHRHHAGQVDPHVWLSLPLLKIQASNIAGALKQLDPVHARQYGNNLAVLLKEIDATHARIGGMLKPYRGQTYYVFHPAFGYFGDAYGLRQEAVEVGGKKPTPRQLRGLIKRARAEGVKIIFVQPQFDRRSARVVADAVGAAVVPIDPLARDVLKNLEEMASRIEKALRK